MSNYRIYLVSGGHIKAGYDFECETDAYAITQAEAMLGEHTTAEVWLGTRQVGVVGSGTPIKGAPRWKDLDSSLTRWRH
jgi:hypothetical protein